jgi:hypothetical protein
MKSRGKRSTRRQLLYVAAGTGAAWAVPASAQTPGAQPGTERVAAPSWFFVVHGIQDPYTGQMQVPQAIPLGMRYAAAEVEIVNDADQSLSFTPLDIRLRDDAGVEYRGGSAIGGEPMINPRNLNPGERSRGWVWFTLPEASNVVEIAYVGPQPQFRVPLPL